MEKFNEKNTEFEHTLFGGIATEMFFDDEPVDSIIEGKGLHPPTPADIIVLWSYNESQDISVEAVAKILCNYPETASRIRDFKKGEETLWNALESVEDDPGCIKTAIFLAALSSIYRKLNHQHMAVCLQRCAAELVYKKNNEVSVQIIKKLY